MNEDAFGTDALAAAAARAARNELAAGRALNGTRRRIEGAFYFLLLPFFGLGGRLVYLQALHGGQTRPPDFVKEKTRVLPARRADILAYDGTAIAVTLDEYSVCANPRAIAQKEKVARVVAECIGGDPTKFLALLAKTTKPDGSPNYYVRLARHVDAGRVARLKKRMGPPAATLMPVAYVGSRKFKVPKESPAAKLRRKTFWSAISFEPTPRRTYPMGNFASQLIGFTAGDRLQGVAGLEHSFNDILAGKPGMVRSQVDTQGRPIPGYIDKMVLPVNGQTLVTTIDPEIQADSDAAVQGLVAKYHPNFAVALVMRPQTGEVLAMSTAPAFDPNARAANIGAVSTNRCTQYAYEPGSTFKVITAAAAIENVPDWQSKHFYCNGVQMVGHHLMHCWINSTAQRRHGDENLADSIRDSCNFGMYGFGRLAGAPTMLKYAQDFGVDGRIRSTGLGGPRGFLSRITPTAWSPEQLANFSFGQGMSMTPLQLGRIYCTVANDGLMMKPTVVKEVRNEQGKVVRVFQPEIDHRVIRPETAHTIRDMMERVLSEGSASKFAWVPGYQAAAKTGSAQKADGKRGYADGKFISSLAGFVPSHQPRYVIIVMADEPHGSHWGSEVCGPAWSGIAQKAMLHLRLRDGVNAPAPDPRLAKAPGKKPGEH